MASAHNILEYATRELAADTAFAVGSPTTVSSSLSDVMSIDLTDGMPAAEEDSGGDKSEQGFDCPHCDKTYASEKSLTRHMRDKKSVCYRNRTSIQQRADDDKGRYACSRCQAQMNKKFSVERHVRDSCWKVCDGCCDGETVECDANKKDGACSSCVKKGISCSKHTEQILDTEIVPVVDQPIRQARKGPRPSKAPKRQAQNSPTASPDSKHVSKRAQVAIKKESVTDGGHNDALFIRNTNRPELLPPAYTHQQRSQVLHNSDVPLGPSRVAPASLPQNLWAGFGPLESYRQGFAGALPNLDIAGNSAYGIGAQQYQALPLNQTQSLDFDTVHPPESRLGRFRVANHLLSGGCQTDVPRGRPFLASAPGSRMPSPTNPTDYKEEANLSKGKMQAQLKTGADKDVHMRCKEDFMRLHMSLKQMHNKAQQHEKQAAEKDSIIAMLKQYNYRLRVACDQLALRAPIGNTARLGRPVQTPTATGHQSFPAHLNTGLEPYAQPYRQANNPIQFPVHQGQVYNQGQIPYFNGAMGMQGQFQYPPASVPGAARTSYGPVRNMYGQAPPSQRPHPSYRQAPIYEVAPKVAAVKTKTKDRNA
ncbi:hypothetical protein ACN47E_006737 [Coniothyrium glycines]